MAIGIVDSAGNVLLDSLVRPRRKTTWRYTQRIHGADVAPAIRAAVHGRAMVAYGARFEARFVCRVLARYRRIHCCRQAWTDYVGQWSPNAGPNAGPPRPGSWRTLVDGRGHGGV